MILLNEICVHGPPLIECHSAIWFCCDEFKCKILIFFFGNSFNFLGQKI